MIETIYHAHLFCGLGGGARGFNTAEARLGNTQAVFECLGGIDVDAASVRDFGRLAGVPGTCLDLFDRDQYRDFHGKEPPADWREATPDDVRRAFQGKRPDLLFTSPPCKGFSGLLAEGKSGSRRYQALNRLTLRGIFLAMEAYADDPIPFVLLENVPRIASRGRALLDRITGLLEHYGYAVRETTHDCGELGGLAQSRKRFLLVARHAATIKPHLYEPDKRPLRAVGEVLSRMPLPGDERGGVMHRVPSLQWATWVRLAFVEAGSDWRSLQRLRVADGVLRDFALVPEDGYRNGVLGVRAWGDTTGVVAGESLPFNGAYSVADPRRAEDRAQFGQYGVGRWTDPGQTVTGQSLVGGGRHAVADPRPGYGDAFRNVLRVVRLDEPSPTVTGGGRPSNGGLAVADPRHHGPAKFNHVARTVGWEDVNPCVTSAAGFGGLSVADPRPPEGRFPSKYRVSRMDEAAGVVISASGSGDGAYAVADPRWHESRPHYQTGGHYGVRRWSDPSGAVTSSLQHDCGFGSVADPRLPVASDRLVCVIRSLDNCWHRPFSTLELAALQGLVDPEEQLELDGLSDTSWRERIGNAVPPPAARAIASEMGEVILRARAGEGFRLSARPVWVRPLAIALSLPSPAGH